MSGNKGWIWAIAVGLALGAGIWALGASGVAGLQFLHPGRGFWLLPIGALSALISWLMYVRHLDILPKWAALSLGTFRFIVLFVVASLFLEPQFSLKTKQVSPPLAAILVDQSESMVIKKDSNFTRNELPLILAQFTEKLKAGGAGVETFGFGNKVFPIPALDSLRFDQDGTNISGALAQARKMYANQNLGAIILLSDGIPTAGESPLYGLDAFKQPIFTVLTGDTTPRKDIWISEILHNEIAYLENESPIKVFVNSQGFDNQTVTVSLSNGPKVLGNKTLTLSKANPNAEVDFLFRPEKAGINAYTVSVTASPGELTLRNNTRTFYMNVLETKVRIALIAGYPHPDLGALHQTLDQDPRFAVTDFIHSNQNEFYNDPGTGFGNFDLAILHNFPFSGADARLTGLLAAEVQKRNLPLMVFVGENTHLPTLQAQLGEHIGLFPASQKTGAEEAQLDFKPEYANHSTFTFDENWLSLMASAPPVFRNPSDWRVKGDTKVLATARIKNISVNYPLFALQHHLNRKNMMFIGENFWRIRSHVFEETQSFQPFDDWIFNLIQWLVVKEDKRKFKVSPSKMLYSGNESAILRGEVYDDSYKPLPGVDIKLKITTPDGKEETPSMKESAPGQAILQLDHLAEGTYRFTAEGTKSGTVVGTDRGEFSVGRSSIEHFTLQSDKNLMNQVALRTRGKMVGPEGLVPLAEEILNLPSFKPEAKTLTRKTGLQDYARIFFLLLLLLAAEWIVRKRFSLP